MERDDVTSQIQGFPPYPLCEKKNSLFQQELTLRISDSSPPPGLKVNRNISQLHQPTISITANMVSENVVKLCQAAEVVSSVLGKDPTAAPGDIVKQLYGSKKDVHSQLDGHPPVLAPEQLEIVRQCGRWGPTQPSPLFLQVFGDALNCLDADPMSGVVSPPLMGSHGTMPLTVIAPLADIIRHVSNLIVRAEREVFFITCSWSPSVAQKLISDALIELSKRAGARGQRVVVKM